MHHIYVQASCVSPLDGHFLNAEMTTDVYLLSVNAPDLHLHWMPSAPSMLTAFTMSVPDPAAGSMCEEA